MDWDWVRGESGNVRHGLQGPVIVNDVKPAKLAKSSLDHWWRNVARGLSLTGDAETDSEDRPEIVSRMLSLRYVELPRPTCP